MYSAQSPMFTTKGPGARRRELHRHDFTSRAQGRDFAGCSPGDTLLPPEQEPALGAHLFTPRFAYQHHGVYVGRGMVVHYAAFAKHWRCGPVEEVSLTRFAHGHPVWVRPARGDRFHCAEIVRRARNRLGENRYRFFSNNCEHLSEWCVNGEHRSLQVEHLLAPLRRLSTELNNLLRLLHLPTGRCDRCHKAARLPLTPGSCTRDASYART